MVLSVGVVAGARVGKRDDAPFVPARVDLPLLFDAGGRYVINVQMVSTGPSPFTLSFMTLCCRSGSVSSESNYDDEFWCHIRGGESV